MSKTTLLRIIEAGYLARQAVLEPLTRLGLEQGDDAVLMALTPTDGATTARLAEEIGLPTDLIENRLLRLERKGVLTRLMLGENAEPGARLTVAGRLALDEINAHWEALETALTKNLDTKDQKRLRRQLRHIIETLDA